MAGEMLTLPTSRAGAAGSIDLLASVASSVRSRIRCRAGAFDRGTRVDAGGGNLHAHEGRTVRVASAPQQGRTSARQCLPLKAART